ncbi:MAG: RloB family protein [Holosporales bacterium]|jgi:hypothetical protein|nr:RloB family protein [Holosporales bacterium]
MVKRKSQKRKLRKISYAVCAEGEKTEIQYLNILKKQNNGIFIKIFSCRRKTTPEAILNTAKKRLENEEPNEIWLMLDVDDNKSKDFDNLFKWKMENIEKNHLAISNPCFEFFLLLHYEKPKGQLTIKSCQGELKRHIPNYDKSTPEGKFSLERIKEAIKRAEDIESENEDIKITERNGSTVYKLAKKVIEH